MSSLVVERLAKNTSHLLGNIHEYIGTELGTGRETEFEARLLQQQPQSTETASREHSWHKCACMKTIATQAGLMHSMYRISLYYAHTLRKAASGMYGV